jgi:hypothetical protein
MSRHYGPKQISTETIDALRAAGKADPSLTYRQLGKLFGLSGSYTSLVLRGLCRKDRDYTPAPHRPRRKLTWDDVRAIRAAYTDGATLKALAFQYGVSNVAIHFIVTAHTWANDPELGRLTRIMKQRHKLVPMAQLEAERAA